MRGGGEEGVFPAEVGEELEVWEGGVVEGGGGGGGDGAWHVGDAVVDDVVFDVGGELVVCGAGGF